MSLSEKDREILLHEIQQIQQTLESTGRSFGTCASDEDDETVQNWTELEWGQDSKGFFHETKDEEDQEAFTTVSIAYDPPQRISNEEENHDNLISETSNLMQNDQPLVTNFLQNLEENKRNSSNSETVSNIPIKNENIESGLTRKLKKRLAQDSQLCDNASKEKGVYEQSADNVNLLPLVSSAAKKKTEQINMSNLYVERIFRDYRKDKHKPSPSIASKGHHEGRLVKSSASLSTLENLLQVNRQYQEVLKDELKKVELAVTRNRKAQHELAQSGYKKDSALTINQLSRACIGRFGNPYFKDFDGLGPPDNEDTKEKKRNMQAGPFTKPSKPWKHSETVELQDGVYQNNLEKRIEHLMQRLKKIEKDCKGKTNDEKMLIRRPRTEILKKITEIKSLPRDELLKDVVDIDFFKISKHYVPTREDFECRLQWYNVIHPSINQKKFTKEEDAKLIKLAKKYENHHWEAISKELGTNRTPVQCLQRFQRTLNKEMIKTTWDAEDDAKLKEAVRIYGNNWVAVANHVGNKLSDQCLNRWEKSLNPNIKRGKWTEDEDKALIAAVKKHGMGNWKAIKLVVPGRTDAQCRERYVSSLDPNNDFSPFTTEEDKKLIAAVKTHGTGKWSQIAKEFPGRRDSQIWRRYTQIKSDEYFAYRRETHWKKKSVINYFGKLGRRSEKRDYEITDLEVNYSPSVNPAEAKKLKRARDKLLDVGLNEEEATKHLARMHFDGVFSKSTLNSNPVSRVKETTTLGRQLKEPVKITRNSIVNTTDPGNSSANEELNIAKDITQVISSVDNPRKDLPSTKPALLLNTKTENLVTIQIPKGVFGQTSRQRVFVSGSDLKYSQVKRKCESLENAHREMKLSTSALQKELNDYRVVITNAVIEETKKKKLLELIETCAKQVNTVDNDRTDNQNAILRQSEFDIVIETDQAVSIKQEPEDIDSIEKDFIDFDLGSRKRKNTDSTVLAGTLIKKERVESVGPTSRPYAVTQVDTEKNANTSGVVMSDQLKTFTLLLQALHVDTAGVMKALPRNNLAGSCPSNNSLLSNAPFPTCYPLSPTESSLHGFRTLLLHRRVLGDIVNRHYENTQRDLAYQRTRSYQALRNRFRSIFMWPAFLATFIPKRVIETNTGNTTSAQSSRSRPGLNPITIIEDNSSDEDNTKDSIQIYIEKRMRATNRKYLRKKISLLQQQKQTILDTN